MLGNTIERGLPRRVSAYYMLFSLIAVVLLCICLMVTWQTIASKRADNTCRSVLDKASSAAVLQFLRRGNANLQPLVERIGSQNSLVYVSIVSGDGCYLAHTSPKKTGRMCREPIGSRRDAGGIEVVHFAADDSKLFREYRAPLETHERTFGSLRIAIAEPNIWGNVLSVGEYAPFAILVPTLFVAVGAFVLQRTVRPLADIEVQLRQAAVVPTLQDASLRPVRARGAGVLGWNRLVDELQGGSRQGSLDERLNEAVGALKQDHGTAVLDSLPDGIAVSGTADQITHVNQTFVALLGSGDAKDQFIGRPMQECLKLEEQLDADHALNNPSTSTRSAVAELSRSTPGGQQFLRIARHPILSSAGKNASGSVWMVRDVTQQKLAEKMRDDFLNSATHELRTPLANLKAYAETLASCDAQDTERQREFCNTINAEATRLARFVDDFLCISSIEAGSLTLTEQKVDLDRMLREVVEKVRPLMDSKGIPFDFSIPDKLPEPVIDKDKIAAALVNMLSNAAKYTPRGGRVAFRVRIVDQKILASVEDTGLGISQEELPKIFDKFFRSDDERVQDQTGSGLGLSLAQEVAHLHGGKITVESELDKGSTFTLALPIKLARWS